MAMLGIIMIASASSILAFNQQKDSFFYLKRQVASLSIGLPLLFILAKIDYRRLKYLSYILLFISLCLLGFVILYGRSAYGSSRWFTIMGFTFQPSELAKLSIAIYTASILSQKPKWAKDIKRLILPLGVPMFLAAALVMLQPDMGTTFTLVITVFFLLFLADAKILDLAKLAFFGSIAGALFIAFAGYRRERFLAFLHPWSDPEKNGFQIIQSLYALGSGGIRGVGLGLSRQKFGFLPTPFTDFIFAIIGEELGLAGSLLVVALFIAFGYLGIKIATRARDRFGRLLAGGLTAMIVTQALINLGAVTGTLPITGIPLPLISFGGSSLIFTMAAIGIILSVANRGKRMPSRRAQNESNNLRRGHGRPRISRIGSGRGA